MVNIKNGVDVDALIESIEAFKSHPDKALVEFSATTEWVSGAYSRAKIRDFTLDIDEPKTLLGSNKAPNPVEIVLAALGSCLAVGFAYNAAAWGIDLESMSIEARGELDLQGFLGISDKVRPGYKDIKVMIKIKSSAPREKIRELHEHVLRTSPVLDIIRNVEPVTVILEDPI